MISTPLVGRSRELETARQWLDGDARLLTVWGPPGIGKTRLAQVLAAEMRPPPIWVAVAGVSGDAGLVAAVSTALGGGLDVAGELARLGERWLVLDTVEHLLDGEDGREVVARLQRWLRGAPELTVVVTSQRRLRIPEERALELGPLDPATSATELFVARVAQQRPDYAPDAVERQHLVRLAGALEGIPLAIELAAARFELLGVQGLLERLERPLAVLAQPRSADPRHGTLRQAIGWSWELLGPADRQALAALARFRRSFDIQAAEALVGPFALERLEALRDAALIRLPAPGRFQLFDSIRAFVDEQTSTEDRERLAEDHAAWCVARVPDPDSGRSEPELLDDLEAAARFLLGRGDPRAERALGALAATAPGQHLPLLEHAVSAMGLPGVLRARGRALRRHGRSAEARRDFDAALSAARDPRERGHLLRELGVLHHGLREIEAARVKYTEALACHIAVGDRRSEAVTIGNLGALDHDVCQYEDAELRYVQALTGLRAVGDQRVEAIVLQNQAVLRQEQGQLEAAEAAYRRALSLLAPLGDARMQAITKGNLGLLLHELGRLAEAQELHVEALGHFSDVRDPSSEALCRARLAAVHAAMGDLDAARDALHKAEQVVARAGDPTVTRVVVLFTAFVAAATEDSAAVDAAVGAAEAAVSEGHALVDISADARVAVRLLRTQVPQEAPALQLKPEGFCVPGGEWQDLSRYANTHRMFEALVAARRAGQGVLTLEDLFEAGWPQERIHHDSMRNRVHVNLARLRRLGLKRVLQRHPDGYRLDPEVPLSV